MPRILADNALQELPHPTQNRLNVGDSNWIIQTRHRHKYYDVPLYLNI